MAAAVADAPYKLICRAEQQGERVVASVRSERVPPREPVSAVGGSSSSVRFDLDTMPGISVTAHQLGPVATAYGLLADLMGHLDVDTLAAFLLGALDPATRQRVANHLATGCAQCLDERGWLERVLSLARTDDNSVEPPSHVLVRAVRIMLAAQPRVTSGEALWRRVRALPIFVSLGAAAPAGARGAAGATRQVLYAGRIAAGGDCAAGAAPGGSPHAAGAWAAPPPG